MAMLCRRGAIRGGDVGAIRVGPTSSIVQIAGAVAESFAAAAKKADPQDPSVHVRPARDDLDAPTTARRPSRAPATKTRREPADAGAKGGSAPITRKAKRERPPMKRRAPR